MLQVSGMRYAVRNIMGFRTKFEIQNVDFELEKGYMMCLLGKNGSGKSTLLRLIYGLFQADEGDVIWNGMSIKQQRHKILQKVAYTGDENIFFEWRSIRENVEVIGQMYESFDMKSFIDYLAKFELDSDVMEKSMIELSVGQKQQVQIAFALARKPKLLLLDEPFANLDVVFRVEFIDILQHLIADEEISVIFSTHILDEVEDIVDYIGVMKQGEMVMFGDREAVLNNSKTLRDLI